MMLSHSAEKRCHCIVEDDDFARFVTVSADCRKGFRTDASADYFRRLDFLTEHNHFAVHVLVHIHVV